MVWIIFTKKLHDVAKDLKVQNLLSNDSVPLKKLIHFCSNFWKTCAKKLHHPPILPISSIREVLLPRYRQMNAYTMDSVTCLGNKRTFPIQISWLGTTCLISLGINKQQKRGNMVDKWSSVLLKITLSPPLPLGVQYREITLVITMWLLLFFSSKRQAISLRTLIHQTQSSNSFYVADFYLYNICHYLQQWNDMLYSSLQRPNCYSKSHSWEFYMEI